MGRTQAAGEPDGAGRSSNSSDPSGVHVELTEGLDEYQQVAVRTWSMTWTIPLSAGTSLRITVPSERSLDGTVPLTT
ncbi:MAG: hypothetical protein ACOC9H_00020 [Gemmatimonadota bacterium]